MTNDEFRQVALAQLGRAFTKLPAQMRAELIDYMEKGDHPAEFIEALRAADRTANAGEAPDDDSDPPEIDLHDDDRCEGLASALLERMVSYAGEIDTEITPDECTIAALYLLMKCIAGYEHEENRIHAAAKVMTLMPKLVAETLARPDEGSDVAAPVN